MAFLAALVLAVWAVLEAVGCDGPAITITALLLLLVALGVHFRFEMGRHA